MRIRSPVGFPEEIRRALAEQGVAGGAFRFKPVDADSAGMRLLERLVDWRCRLFELPMATRGIFVRREVFDQVGGFPDTPLLEDYEADSGGCASADGSRWQRGGQTSARRWRKLGLWRATLSNNLCLVAYWMNVPAATIALAWHYVQLKRSARSSTDPWATIWPAWKNTARPARARAKRNVVRDDHLRMVQIAHHGNELLARRRVEEGRGLVEQDDLRVHGEHASERRGAFGRR
ncbi:MAG: hypothetical protein R2748_31445 [Bryobacterales bacterium]